MFFSDDCPDEDPNEFSEFNSSGDTNHVTLIHPMPQMNYPTSNYIKHRDMDVRSAQSLSSPRNVAKTPERSIRSSSITTPVHTRERSTSNADQEAQNKDQVDSTHFHCKERQKDIFREM